MMQAYECAPTKWSVPHHTFGLAFQRMHIILYGEPRRRFSHEVRIYESYITMWTEMFVILDRIKHSLFQYEKIRTIRCLHETCNTHVIMYVVR